MSYPRHRVGDIVRLAKGWTPMTVIGLTPDNEVIAQYGTRNSGSRDPERQPMSLRPILLNTVSYAAMALPFMAEEEKIFLNSDEFKKMKAQESKARLMAVISQTMRSGKRLSMFAPGHRIQPPKVVDAAAL